MNNKNNWYNTGRSPKFFVIDAKASLFFVLFLVHIRFETFILLIIIFVFFYILETQKIDLRILLKITKSSLSGNRRKIRKSNK